MSSRLLILLLVIMIGCAANAQQKTLPDSVKRDTAVAFTGKEQVSEPDDDFNIFLMVFAVGFMSAAIGAVMAGAFAVFLLLGVSLLLTVTGVLSASLFIGLYKRSLRAGFKSFVLIISGITGIAFGLFALWLITVFFSLHLTGYQILLIGAGGGLTGGLLLGWMIFKMIKSLLKTAFGKLNADR